jgi:hypothetical protein
MDQLEKVCRAIQARDRHLHDLEETEKSIQALPWHSFIKRVSLRQKIASLQSEIDAYGQKINPDTVLELAYLAGAKLWNHAAQTLIPKKNPYGRAAVEHFDEILELALKGREKINLWIGRGSFELSSLTDVTETLTEKFIKSNAQRIIAERRSVAASTEFIHELFENDDGHPAMIIQHVASGLRAVFTIKEPGLGSVFSKPYRIGSIDPSNPGTAGNWEMYAGLGIGEQIYREAHHLLPEVRWLSGATTEFSARLREKLHASDPYIWSGRCQWCAQKLDELHIFTWEAADQEFFTNHP